MVEGKESERTAGVLMTDKRAERKNYISEPTWQKMEERQEVVKKLQKNIAAAKERDVTSVKEIMWMWHLRTNLTKREKELRRMVKED